MEKSGDAEPHQAPILSPRVLPAPPPYGYAASYHVPAAGATNPSVHPFWSISLDNLWSPWFWYLYVFTNCSQGLGSILDGKSTSLSSLICNYLDFIVLNVCILNAMVCYLWLLSKEEIIGRIGDAPGMPWQRNKSLLLQFNYAS